MTLAMNYGPPSTGAAEVAYARQQQQRQAYEQEKKRSAIQHKASLTWFETQANLIRQNRQLRASGGLAGGRGDNGGRTMLTDFLYNAQGKTLLGS